MLRDGGLLPAVSLTVIGHYRVDLPAAIDEVQTLPQIGL